MALEVVSRGRKHLIERDPAWADGRYRATFTIHDQHFADNNGAWQEVNEGLVADATDGYTRACTTCNHTLRVGAGGTRRWYPRRNVTTEYVAITGIEYYSTRWRNLNLPSVVWRNNGADWDLTNLSASLTNTWKRVKAEFVLKNSSAYTRLRFAVTLVGLTLGADWQLRNASNEIVGSIDPPTAQDANGATVPVTGTYAGGYVEWSVTTTGATFPVYVDPTFTDGTPGPPTTDAFTSKDTYLSSLDTDAAYGGATGLGGSSAAYHVNLLGFTCSSIAAGSTCDTATISLYQTGAGAAQAFTLTAYSIASGNGDWVEGASQNPATGGQPTWNYKAQTAADAGTAWAGSVGCGTSGTDYESSALGTHAGDRSDANGTEWHIPLTPTSRVANWFGASNTNYGVRVTASAGVGGMGSSETVTATYRPKLVVDYTEASSGTPIPVFLNQYRQRAA